MTRRGSRQRAGCGAFTLVELMAASSMAAVFITAAVLGYAAITENRNQLHSFGTVEIGQAAVQNFYGSIDQNGDGQTDSFRNVLFAPNYRRAAELDTLRDVFWEDVGSACAVFCMARAGFNTYRPLFIPLSLSADARGIDTPEKFHAVLNAAAPGVFTSYRTVPPANASSASVFVLWPSDFPTVLKVRAVYDIDLVSSSSPAGTYVSIRRYEGGARTFIHELFYPAGDGFQTFRPLFVAFERADRLVVTEPDHDPFKRAANRPFYFMWWPDPADKRIEAFPNGSVPNYAATDARAVYREMSGRSSYLFTVPMFPAL